MRESEKNIPLKITGPRDFGYIHSLGRKPGWFLWYKFSDLGKYNILRVPYSQGKLLIYLGIFCPSVSYSLQMGLFLHGVRFQGCVLSVFQSTYRKQS